MSGPAFPRAWLRPVAIGLAVVALQADLYQFSAKYLPWPAWITLLAGSAAAAILYARLDPRRLAAIRPRWLVIGLFFAAAIAAVALVYPVADALSAQQRGSDADDCVRVVANNLLAGRAPYAHAYSYLGNPCSTGLGEAVAYLPFVALGLTGFGALALLGLCVLALQRRDPRGRQADLFAIFLGSSLSTWHQLAVGSDFPFIGCGALLVLLILERNRLGPGWILVAAILCGAIASSRAALAYLPAVYVLILARRTPWVAAGFGALAVVATAALNLGPYLASPATFTPAHVFPKGAAILSGAAPTVAPLCLAAGLLMVALAWKTGPASGRLVLAIGLGTPMAIIAGFSAYDGTITLNYLTAATPALCAWLAQVFATGPATSLKPSASPR